MNSMWLFELKLIQLPLKIQFLHHTSHISSVPVAHGYCTGQCRYRMFLSLQKVLLDRTGLDFSLTKEALIKECYQL